VGVEVLWFAVKIIGRHLHRGEIATDFILNQEAEDTANSNTRREALGKKLRELHPNNRSQATKRKAKHIPLEGRRQGQDGAGRDVRRNRKVLIAREP